MLILSHEIPKEQIDKESQSVIETITKWFNDNPNRLNCAVKVWYDRLVSIGRNNIVEDVTAAANQAVNSCEDWRQEIGG